MRSEGRSLDGRDNVAGPTSGVGGAHHEDAAVAVAVDGPERDGPLGLNGGRARHAVDERELAEPEALADRRDVRVVHEDLRAHSHTFCTDLNVLVYWSYGTLSLHENNILGFILLYPCEMEESSACLSTHLRTHKHSLRGESKSVASYRPVPYFYGVKTGYFEVHRAS